jgi:hypothetical protein
MALGLGVATGSTEEEDTQGATGWGEFGGKLALPISKLAALVKSIPSLFFPFFFSLPHHMLSADCG